MKFFKKTDVLIVLGIIAVGLSIWAFYNYRDSTRDSTISAQAEIYYKSELVATIDLNTGVEKEFSIPQKEGIIFHLKEDGSIGFEESNCPDKICVRTGMLKNVGETAACLPNEVILKIVPLKERSDDELDMIVGN